jgi:hypothetical protein
MVGNEGMVGVPVFLGVATPRKLAIVRTAGTAMRMGAPAFYRCCNQNGPLQRLLGQYTHALLAEIAQLSVCHRFHAVDARLARWLLTTQDRLQSDAFTVTQHLIAQRLGVVRVSRPRLTISRPGTLSTTCARILRFSTDLAWKRPLAPVITSSRRLCPWQECKTRKKNGYR